jgi:hypothetical protein
LGVAAPAQRSWFSGGLLNSSPRYPFPCCFAFAEKFATICRIALVLLQGEAGIIFELPDKKLEFF